MEHCQPRTFPAAGGKTPLVLQGDLDAQDRAEQSHTTDPKPSFATWPIWTLLLLLAPLPRPALSFPPSVFLCAGQGSSKGQPCMGGWTGTLARECPTRATIGASQLYVVKNKDPTWSSIHHILAR